MQSAITSARSVRDLHNLADFLVQQTPADTHTPSQSSQAASDDPISLIPPPNAQHAPPLNKPLKLSPQQAVQLLVRLSQLKPCPAFEATPHLDTHTAYAPSPSLLSQADNSSSSSSTSTQADSSSTPTDAGYVSPLLPLQPSQHTRAGEEESGEDGFSEQLSKEERAQERASVKAAGER